MSIKKRFRYHFDQFLSRGTLSLVCMLFAVTFVAVIALGLVAFAVNLSSGDSVFLALWNSFMMTLDAGNLSGMVGSGWYLVILTASTMVGIFVTSMLISIISNGLQTKLENLQKGRSLVIEQNHVLILGYHPSVPVIVSELVEANRNVAHPVIVILAEGDPVETMNHLRQETKSFANTKVIIRSGSSYNADDLRMCAIEKARTVIVAHAEDADTLKALLAMKNTAFYESEKGYAVSLFKEKKNLKIAEHLFGERLVAVSMPDDLERITAQTCLQPGLSFVYKNLLEFAGDEIYFFQSPEIVGKTIGELINRFEKSALIGLFHDGLSHLNPAADVRVAAGDQLIMISQDDDTMLLDGHPEAADSSKIVMQSHARSKHRRHFLTVGYNQGSLGVLAALCPYVEKESEVTMIAPTPIRLPPCAEGPLANLRFTMVEGDPTDYDVLKKIDYRTLDAIAIFANSAMTPEDADSATLMSVLNLREILKEAHLDVPIIIEIMLNRNEAVLQYASVDDFIISDVLSHKLLCQIAENRHLKGVLTELFDETGSEIYMKRAEDYVVTGEPVTFATVVLSALKRGETAIGYMKKGASRRESIVLNPPKSVPVTLMRGDIVIVLAED